LSQENVELYKLHSGELDSIGSDAFIKQESIDYSIKDEIVIGIATKVSHEEKKLIEFSISILNKISKDKSYSSIELISRDRSIHDIWINTNPYLENGALRETRIN